MLSASTGSAERFIDEMLDEKFSSFSLISYFCDSLKSGAKVSRM